MGQLNTKLGIEFTEGLDAYAKDVRVAHVQHVGHWVQQEAPDQVNELLLQFLRG